MSSHVLDTCALLDLAADCWTHLAARTELSQARDPAVLSVSVWEIARMLRTGKLKLPCAQDEVLKFVLAVCNRYQLRLVALTGEICEQAELLPPHHEDPFDRMILATATAAGATVFTMDPRFRNYSVQLVNYR